MQLNTLKQRILIRPFILGLMALVICNILVFYAFHYAIAQARIQDFKDQHDHRLASEKLQITHFQELLERQHQLIMEALDQNQSSNIFDTELERKTDGTIRNITTRFNSQTTPGVWVNYKTKLTATDRQLINTIFQTLQAGGPSIYPTFQNIYFNAAANYTVVYWPNYLCAQQIPRHLTFAEKIYFKTAAPQENPQKRTVWTASYYDPIGNNWFTSCLIPIYYQNQFTGVLGSDLSTLRLFNRLQWKTGADKYSFILNDQLEMIVHPELKHYLDRTQNSEQKTFTSGHLASIQKLVKSLPQKSGLHYHQVYKEWIYISAWPGPDWYFISVLPNKSVYPQALNYTLLSTSISFLLLLLFTLSTAQRLRTTLIKPTRQLLTVLSSPGTAPSEALRRAQHQAYPTIHALITSITEIKANHGEELFKERQVNIQLLQEKHHLVRNLETHKTAYIKLRDIVNATRNISIIATDPQGLITVFNRGAQLMLGYSAAEMIGLQTPKLFHLEEEMIEFGKQLSFKYGEEISGFDVFVYEARHGYECENRWTYVCKDGSRVPVSLSITPVKDNNGQITGYLGVARNLTSIVKAMKQVSQTQSTLETVIDAIPAILIGVDRFGKVTFANQSAKLRANPEFKVAARPDFSLMFPQFAKLENEIYTAIDENRPCRNAEIPVQFQNFTSYYDLSIYPLLNRDGVIIRLYDATQRHHLKATMGENNKRNQLIHDLSHRLDTILQDCIEETNHPQLAHQAQLLNQQLHDLTSPDLTHFENLNLFDFLHQLIQTNKPAYPAYVTHTLRCSAAHKQFQAQGSVLGLTNLFNCLIRNAIEAAAGTPIQIEMELNLIHEASATFAEVVVKDNGPGLSEEYFEQLFEPFFTTKTGGLGLGLTGARTIAHEHGGKLKALPPQTGQGATFVVTLPLTSETDRFQSKEP